MTDASAGTLLDELNGKRRRWPSLPFVFALPAVCFLFLIFSQNTTPQSPSTVQLAATLFTCALIAFVPLLVAAYLWDRRRFCVVMYSLDDQATIAYQTLHNSFGALAASSVIWHVRAHAAVYDRKYVAGASTLLDTRPTRADKQEPPLVRTNLETVSILASDGTRLCFFPDRLLVFSAQGVGAVNYRDIHIQSSETRFILDTSPPRDARVVDWTWQYLNKKGGPDRRFSHNPRKPIIHCECLHFSSASGLNEVFQFSRPGVVAPFEHAVRHLTSTLDDLSSAPVHSTDPLSPAPSQFPAVQETPARIPTVARTIFVLGTCGVVALIVWAVGTHKRKNDGMSTLSTPALITTVQSPATPKVASLPTQPSIAVPTATLSPPRLSNTPLASASVPAEAATPLPTGADFNRLVMESQRRAMSAYPALGRLGSPINSRFVKRYTALRAAASPRLNEPDWPEKLARECVGEAMHR